MQFNEIVNGRAREGQCVTATVNGEKVGAAYVRPVLARPHRCRLVRADDKGRNRFFTVSTRKVTF